MTKDLLNTTQPAMELPALPEPMAVLSDADILACIRGWRQYDAPDGLDYITCAIYGACRSALNAYYDRARASASSAAVGEKRCHFAGCPHGAECVHATQPSAQQEGD